MRFGFGLAEHIQAVYLATVKKRNVFVVFSVLRNPGYCIGSCWLFYWAYPDFKDAHHFLAGYSAQLFPPSFCWLNFLETNVQHDHHGPSICL